MASPSSWRLSVVASIFVFEVCAEDVVDLREERLELPLVGVGLFGGVLVEDVGEDGGEVVLGDELLLVDAFHELAAQAVDGFALLVHDVVVLEDVFAGLEVLRFDGLLRGLDAAGDHAGSRWARPLPCRGAGAGWRPTRGRRCA